MIVSYQLTSVATETKAEDENITMVVSIDDKPSYSIYVGFVDNIDFIKDYVARQHGVKYKEVICKGWI